jgi:hypothetical protein
LARAQARRHQRERIAGIALAALGVAVLVIAIVALREPNGHVNSGGSHERTSGAAKNTPQSSHPAPTSSAGTQGSAAPSASSSAPPTDAVKSVPLVVYNDTAIQGLAHDAAQRFEQGGWTVSQFDNLPSGISDIISTCAYYEPGDPSAKAAAEALAKQYPTIQRTKPKFGGLGDGPVVVVLTPDYTAG